MLRLDCESGELTMLGDAEEFAAREPVAYHRDKSEVGLGRELFSVMRAEAGDAASGASFFSFPGM